MSEITAGSFNEVPADGRVSGIYIEIDPSQAGTYSDQHKALLLGQKLGTGSQAAGSPVLITGDGSIAKTLFGRGSMLAGMVAAFRANNPTMEMHAIALDDDGAGVAATGNYTVAGPATGSGTLYVYVGGGSRADSPNPVKVGVSNGDTAETIASAIVDAINGDADLPVTAAVNGAVAAQVDVTCRHAGEVGNDLRVLVNLRGETMPAGVTVTPDTASGWLTGGTGNPDQAAVIAAIEAETYEHIVVPYRDANSLDAWKVEMADRWGPLRQQYGACYTSEDDTPAGLVTFGETRNDPAFSCVGAYNLPRPAYTRAARYAAICGRALANHAARPLHGLTLVGELPPVNREDRLAWADQNSLLWAGISTLDVTAGGEMVINRAVTMYRVNDVGDPDNAWLDLTTRATVMARAKRMRWLIHQKFIAPRCVLVDDGTPIASGVPHVNPRRARAEIIADYEHQMRLGLMERREAFEDRLIVNRDPEDPTRLLIQDTPDLANPLVQAAVKVTFALQWPSNQVQ